MPTRLYQEKTFSKFPESSRPIPKMSGQQNDKYYAVAKGRMPGVYKSWDQCEEKVKGFSDAKFKKFDSMQGAQDFIVSHGAETVLRDKLTREVSGGAGSSGNSKK